MSNNLNLLPKLNKKIIIALLGIIFIISSSFITYQVLSMTNNEAEIANFKEELNNKFNIDELENISEDLINDYHVEPKSFQEIKSYKNPFQAPIKKRDLTAEERLRERRLAQEKEAEDTRLEIENRFIVSGLIFQDFDKLAVLRDLEDDQTHMVRKGDLIGNLEVRYIGEDKVKLKEQDQDIIYELGGEND